MDIQIDTPHSSISYLSSSYTFVIEKVDEIYLIVKWYTTELNETHSIFPNKKCTGGKARRIASDPTRSKILILSGPGSRTLVTSKIQL
jgi:hypothetical protein